MDGEGGEGRPGILTLRQLLDEHGDEITADFYSEYGLDILDVFRGALSPRRALALVEQLPLDSRFATAKRGGVQHYGWDRQTYLLADLFDVLSSILYVTVKFNASHPKKVKEPDPYPRPENKRNKPDILLARLRGEADEPREVGPGSLIPLPPS